MEAAPTEPQAASADQHRAEPQADIVLGVIVAPGLARDVTAKVASELAHDLEALDLGVEWRTELTVDRLVAPPAQTTEIIDAAKAGDTAKKEEAANRWNANADDIATFLSGANPKNHCDQPTSTLTIFFAITSAAAFGASAVRNSELVTAVVANAVHIT